MEPMTFAAILAIQGVAQLASSLVQAGNIKDAQKVIADATAKYGPEARGLIEKELGGPSAYEGVTGEKLAPEAVSAQREALRRMQQVAAGGYTPEEQAALNRIQQQSAAQVAQQQAALKSQMARRGIAGTGQELAMNLAGLGQQTAAQYQAGLDVAANAQRRAFQAMQGLGSEAGAMRQQTVAERQAAAAAEEARKLNRMRAGLDVAGTEYGNVTGTARAGAEAANLPWKTGSEFVGKAGQTAFDYWGNPKKGE